jgi:hypothetical protein
MLWMNRRFSVSFDIERATANKDYNKKCTHDLRASRLYEGWLEYVSSKNISRQFVTHNHIGMTEYSKILLYVIEINIKPKICTIELITY